MLQCIKQFREPTRLPTLHPVPLMSLCWKPMFPKSFCYLFLFLLKIFILAFISAVMSVHWWLGSLWRTALWRLGCPGQKGPVYVVWWHLLGETSHGVWLEDREKLAPSFTANHETEPHCSIFNLPKVLHCSSNCSEIFEELRTISQIMAVSQFLSA